MRVLAIADKPLYVDPAKLALKHEVDLVITLGDLQPSWIEPLEHLRLPKVGVYGNHDDERYMDWYAIDDLHMRRLDLDGGFSFCGFEGCVSYRRSSSGRVGPSYTQKEAKKLIRKLPPADVLVCHCPPRGVNDDPEDPAHIGFDALRDWVDKHQPRWLLHGHVHPLPGQITDRVGHTRVVYVSGLKIFELD
jgi:Icc-related predicted phosphoesterase